MSLHDPASVSIDGQAIRSIREHKQLTQLYVAKVVGVTTDTVSRWENNRYPTIRRDNALKLADALEVDLEEILKQADPVAEEPSAPSLLRRWMLIVPLCIVVLMVLWYLLEGGGTNEPLLHAERWLPAHAAPGSRILVRVQVSAPHPLKGLIVKEKLPEGWRLLESVPAVSSLSSAGAARWMVRKPQSLVEITYLIEIDPSAQIGSDVTLQGEVVANPDGKSSTVPLGGSGTMKIAPQHWVDVNRDFIIDDFEILDISDLFGQTTLLEREWEEIEDIWDAGGYRWDPEQVGFVARDPQ